MKGITNLAVFGVVEGKRAVCADTAVNTVPAYLALKGARTSKPSHDQLSVRTPAQRRHLTKKQRSLGRGKALMIGHGTTHVVFARCSPLTLPVEAKSAQLPEASRGRCQRRLHSKCICSAFARATNPSAVTSAMTSMLGAQEASRAGPVKRFSTPIARSQRPRGPRRTLHVTTSPRRWAT